MNKSLIFRENEKSNDIEKLDEFALSQKDQDFSNKTSKVMILIVVLTFARLDELATLSINDILFIPQPVIKITLGKNTYRSKHRIISMPDDIANILLYYIKYDRCRVIEKTCGLDNDSGALFVHRNTGLGLRAEYMSLMIINYLKQARVPTNITAKDIRRYFLNKFVTPHNYNKLHQ